MSVFQITKTFPAEERYSLTVKQVASVYEGRQMFGDAADWYKKIIYVKKTPGKTDIYNAGIGYYRIKNYPAAIEMFDLYAQKFPEDIFGYYYKGGSQAGIDTLMTFDSTYQTYLKAVAIGEAYPDKSRILPLLKGSYRYLIIYAANKLKDKELALQYVDKALRSDTSDAELKGFRESISKMGNTPPPKANQPTVNSKGEKVTTAADGTITTVAKDGSTTVVTKAGKVTTVKNGVTTITENGKVTTIDKDGKATTVNSPKQGGQKPLPKKK